MTSRFSILSLLLITFLFVSSCSNNNEESATMIIHGGNIYTVDESQPTVEAVAIKDNKILFAGNLNEAENYKGDKTEMIDLEGKTMTPGLIEGHGHFMGLGYNELNLDLMNTTSYQQIVDAVAERVKTAKPGEWITGRGWHQSKWDSMPSNAVKGFQTHHKLSEVSPDNPVYLRHASGHAGFGNAKAMEVAGLINLAGEGITSYEIEGGEVFVDASGRPTGVFNERAQGLITKHMAGAVDKPSAMENCY